MLDELPYDIPSDNLFAPLVRAWTNKIEAGVNVRKKWQNLVDEIMLFYSKSAAALFDPAYARKFWPGNVKPRFRVNINLAYEYVAIRLPELLWENPHRQVEPKKMIELPEELFPPDEQGQPDPIFMAAMQEQQQMYGMAKMSAELMSYWLNYTSREMPGGLIEHSTMATLDALLKGRGCLWTRPYTFPGSGRTVTGCFREPPERLITDPDYKSMRDCRWIALQHIDPHYEVERRFGLPENALRKKGSLESSWAYAESSSHGRPNYAHRTDGISNDMVVWYEVFSKCGVGTRKTDMYDAVKNHLEETVGDYAYLAIAPCVPFPLNCPIDKIKNGATSDDVKQMFAWPIPLFHADDRWPVECLDFYPNNDEGDNSAAWPIPPLAPALGEMKLMNVLVPFLVSRVWTSSRDFWAIAGPYMETLKKEIDKGEDQAYIAVPAVVDDIRKIVTILQQPETRRDMWDLIGLVESLFRKRTGLTLSAYGMNEDGTQNRSAEETIAKARAVGVRSEFMQKMVVDWQSRAAASEAMVARRFITGQDVAPLMGKVIAMLWDQSITTGDVETVVRQLDYTVEAASIRRPNRERDIANFQQMVQYWQALIMQAAGANGDYQPANALMKMWGELHDMDMSAAYIPKVEPDPQQQAMQEQQMQLEQAKMQAEIQGKQMDLQGKQMDVEAKAAELQIEERAAELDMQTKVADMQMDAAGKQQEMEFNARMAQQEMELKSGKGLMEILMGRQKHEQKMQQDAQAGAVKTITAVESARTQMDVMKAKAAQQKKMAQQKPKPRPQGKPK
jgi:hypothetical protein